MDIIKVDPNEIVKLSSEGGQLVFKKSAEDSLVRLLELKKLIDSALDNAKKQIIDSAMKMNPDFRGVEGEQIKIIFRYYGEKYEHDYTKRESLAPFLNRKEYFKVNSEKVDEYLEQVGELPSGITEKDRTKSASIKFLGETYDEE